MVPDRPRSPYGAAKLTDFGVAHLAGDEPLTRTGDVVGTLAYMAPEQAAGERIDERCDLYALGLVLYEGLAGVNPVRAGSPAATLRRVGMAQPPLGKARGDLPAELSAAIDRTLLPLPDERGDLADLADALAEALPEVSDDGGIVAPHPLEDAYAMPSWSARAVAAAAAGALVLCALVGLLPDSSLPAFAAAAAAALLVALLPGARLDRGRRRRARGDDVRDRAARRRRAGRLPRRVAAAARCCGPRRWPGRRPRWPRARPDRARRRLPRAGRHGAQRLDARGARP